MLEEGSRHEVIGYCDTPLVYIEPKEHNYNNVIEVVWQVVNRIGIAIFTWIERFLSPPCPLKG